MKMTVWNILDLVEEYGEPKVKMLLESFSTEKEISKGPLNPDIELFLFENAIQFTKEHKSVSYLVSNEESGDLLGYFTIAHKAMKVTPDGLSNTSKKKIARFSEYNEELNAYLISGFLIAQLGKNYAIPEELQISGDELLRLCYKELKDIRRRIGGGAVYLDCEPNIKLIRFYEDEQQFRLYGQRISKDGKQYLQYMKFLK